MYQWTPTASGTATIQTCGPGTNYDSVLYVRSPTCTGSEVTNGCNDDACANSTGLQRASKVTITVTSGQTYFIFVDGYNGVAGTFSLQVTPRRDRRRPRQRARRRRRSARLVHARIR